MLPEKVKIGSIVYDVYEGEHTVVGDEVLVGEIDYHAANIYINEKSNDQIKEQTLMHEIIHGILVSMGRKDLNEDEFFVDALGYHLHQLLKDNKFNFGTEKRE